MHVMNYAAFREDFRTEDENELHLFEKFHATRSLSENGDVDSFVEATMYDPEKHSQKVRADVVGVEGETLTAVFCETKPPSQSESLIRDLEMVDHADNSKVVIVYPFKIDAGPIDSKFRSSVNSGKFVIEHLNWRDRGLERAFRTALEMMDLLCNETRVKMLLPLLESPQGKRHFREEINPKLIYENVPLLRTHKLIDELSDDLYDLTPMGRTILAEYLTFVDKVSRLLEEREKEE